VIAELIALLVALVAAATGAWAPVPPEPSTLTPDIATITMIDPPVESERSPVQPDAPPEARLVTPDAAPEALERQARRAGTARPG
jgi:hypothetical protein